MDSTVSTSALYGNYKHRAPLPSPPPRQLWISRRVATDVLPLLIHACSDACIAALPLPPKNYHPHPHSGGPGLKQLKADW